MEFGFLKERLERFLAIIPESYKIADEIRKGPKGLSVVVEPDSKTGTSSTKAKGVKSAVVEDAASAAIAKGGGTMQEIQYEDQ